MKRERHVIIGASLAGIRAAEAMRQRGFEGEIVLVGAEPDPPYHRPPLSKEFLRDANTDFEPLAIQPQQFYAEQQIDLRLGTRATRLDAATRTIELDTGERLDADRVVIATGAEPRPLEVPGVDLAGVHYLRTSHDAVALRQRLERSERVVVVGAGLIGLEVASAARAAGKQVTVLEAARAPLRRILGDELGRVIAQLHTEHGVMIRCSIAIARIRGRGTVEAVELSDHSILPTDLVVVGIGVRPAIAWLAGSGLRLDDGIVVDALGQTDIPEVYAAGDAARWFNPVLGEHLRTEQYGNAQAQGATVGRNLTGALEALAPMPGGSSEQFGHRLQAIGRLRGDESLIVRGSLQDRAFVAFFLRDGLVVGGCTVDRSRDFPALRRLVTGRSRVRPAELADPHVPLGELGIRPATAP